MGFWTGKPDSTLSVEFYDDPRQTLEVSDGSVRYTTSGSTENVASDFFQYCLRIVNNLGPASPATQPLIATLQAAIGALSKQSSVLAGPGYRLRLVAPRQGATKYCQADFWISKGPQAKFSRGGEDYYAPMSCLPFLQYIINNFDSNQLARFKVLVAAHFNS